MFKVIDECINFSDPQFVRSFLNYCDERPKLKDYIGSLKVGSGSGWSYELIQCFGLTLYGIEQILTALNIHVPVLVNLHQFKHFIQNYSGGLAKAIISDEIYQKSETGKHVYAIAYQKVKGQHLLYVYDPALPYLPIDVLQACFNAQPFKVYYPTKMRQKPDEANCYAYAIHDLSLIDEYPPPLAAIEQGYFSLPFLSGLSFFSRSGRTVGETSHFELAPEFSNLDIRAYKKNLFKTLIQMELLGQVSSLKLAC